MQRALARPRRREAVAWRPAALSERWLDFNKRLAQDLGRLPNETVIATRLDELLAMPGKDSPLFWLGALRICEMALIQAGAYADACEFRAAGDLLVNPRRIEVAVSGHPRPLVKARHGALRDCFAAIPEGKRAAWMARHVTPCVCQPALLPRLRQLLSESDMIAPGYLDHLDRGMAQVAATIAFLCAWQLADSQALAARRQCASAADQQALEAQLCRFGRQVFDEIGSAIERWCQGGGEGGAVSGLTLGTNEWTRRPSPVREGLQRWFCGQNHFKLSLRNGRKRIILALATGR